MGRQGASSRQSDRRRATRQEQMQQRRAERERVQRQQRQRRRRRKIGMFGGGGVLVLVLIVVVVQSVRQANAKPAVITGTGTYTTAAAGETRDGMGCLGSEGTAEHIHMYLAIYVNGQQVRVPSDTGIVNSGSCYYPLHVHSDTGDENIIHEESSTTDTFTLGSFFDIWGQPLSKTQVMGNLADATRKLQFVTFDGNGHKTTVTGNPLNIQFSEHETIYILYNSPNVTPKPFTAWISGE